MSGLTPKRMPCPRCHALVAGAIAEVLSADRHPELVESLLESRLHRFTCGSCGHAFLVEKELLFTDFAARAWVGVVPSPLRPDFLAQGQIVVDAFQQALLASPPLLRQEAHLFRVRVVFGLAELREKLLCWRSGLEDHLLELLKLEVLAQHADLLEAGTTALVLDSFEHGALTFLDEAGRRVWIDRSGYDEVALAWPQLADQHADLAAGPYVNLRRYGAPMLLPPE